MDQRTRAGETQEQYLMRMIFGEQECSTCEGRGWVALPEDAGFMGCKTCTATGVAA